MHIKEGRVALVTGSGSGIGRSIAMEFAKYNVKVVVSDINKENAEKVVSEIKEAGGEAVAAIGNVAVAEDCKRMVQTAVDNWGRLDILVNNAGVIRDALIKNMTEENWDLVQSVSNKGTFLCIQAAAAVMTEQKYGRIVNMASVAYLGNKGQANYSSAKAGVVALTKVAALELSPDNITVNCVAPGLIRTPLTESLPEKVFERIAKSTPVGFIGETSDITHMVMALVAEEARYITGQVINIDGGLKI